MLVPKENKHYISLRLEQSKILEKLEEIRQLILQSSINQSKIIRLNDSLDLMQFNIYAYYEEKATQATQIGNN